MDRPQSFTRRTPGRIRSSLSRFPRLYRPLRHLYHRIFYAGSTRTVECAGVRRTFVSPTPTIAEQISTFTGEEQILCAFLERISARDIVWDVGASFGMYSIFAAERLAEAASINAFEPEPRMRALLQRNIILNDAHSVRVFPFAIGDRDGEATLYPSDSPNTGTTSMVQRTDYRLQTTGIVVPLYSGDSLVRLGLAASPTMIKIDAEGAEGLILDGLHEILSSSRVDTVCCEVHPRLLPLFDDSAEAVEERLKRHGLSVAVRHERGTEYHILCTRA